MSSMILLKINNNIDRFDNECIIAQMSNNFKNICVHEGDQLQISIEKARETLAGADPKIRETIINSLKRKADQYGPATAFKIQTVTGVEIAGRVRPGDLAFFVDSSPPEPEWEDIINFCKSLGIGDLTVSN